MRFTVLLCAITLLAACAMDTRPEGTLPPSETVHRILLRIAPDDLDVSPRPANIPEIAAEMAKNLRSLSYPVDTSDSATVQDRNISHLMEGRVGKSQKKATPAGLSFGFGNSDPRALDFQKENVVVITCLLRSKMRPSEAVKLSGEFALEKGIENWLQARTKPVSASFLIDRIGTVCLNLLTELKVPKTRAADAGPSQAWTPEVRVEVRDKPMTPTYIKPEPEISSAPRTRPAGQPAVAPASPPPASAEPEPVSVESRNSGDTRKQVIIHNLGNPVILEFGYERK